MTTAPAAAAVRYRVEGMDCPSCVRKIETALRRIDGVTDIRLNFATETLTLQLREPSQAPAAIEKTIGALGFRATPIGAAERSPAGPRQTAPTECRDHGPEHDHDHAQGHRHGQPVDHDHHDHPPHADMRGGKTDGRAAAESRPTSQSSPQALEAADDDAYTDALSRLFLSAWRDRRGRLLILNIALLGLAFGASYLAHRHGVLGTELPTWTFIAAAIIGVFPVARRAIALVRTGTIFSIELLMAVAAAGAVAIGAAEEAAVVVTLFTLGEFLEGVAANRARASIRALSDLIPRTALVVEGDRQREVPAETLAIGQVVLVRPGDRIPADGTIVDGASAVDESPVTGESMPRTKSAGDAVYAGSINSATAIRVRVEKVAADNTIARIVRLVEEAQEAKAPAERFIDRFSAYYTPAVTVVAVLVMVVPPLFLGAWWYDWIYRGLALLLIACPCALVISIPASVTSGLSTGARRGILVKGGAILEAIGNVQTIAFDKTGTLTEGKPRVTDIVAIRAGPKDQDNEVLRFAAAVESGSSHPLAGAIVREASRRGVEIAGATDHAAIAGKAVSATVGQQLVVVGSPRYATELLGTDSEFRANVASLENDGKTVVVVLADKILVGLIAVRDEPRPDAKSALERLRGLGVESVMLTGDNARTAAAIGRQIGIEVRAELLPEDKARIVKQIGEHRSVAKVGDGINDAPALAVADVGIAMGGGTDVALETADAALLNNRIGDVATLVALSRRTMANIRQNVTISLGLKAVFLVTSVAGITGLWPAILADTGATVIVTLNALRLLRFKA